MTVAVIDRARVRSLIAARLQQKLQAALPANAPVISAAPIAAAALLAPLVAPTHLVAPGVPDTNCHAFAVSITAGAQGEVRDKTLDDVRKQCETMEWKREAWRQLVLVRFDRDSSELTLGF